MVYLSKQHGFRSLGLVQAHYEYSPFGKIIVSTGIRPDDFSYRFSTKEFEPNTSLILYQFRAYNPIIGRFLSRDPIGERGGYNLYAILSNDTVNWWDYLGYEPWYKKGVIGKIDNFLTAASGADRVADGITETARESDPTIPPVPEDIDGSRYADLLDAILTGDYYATDEMTGEAYNSFISSFGGYDIQVESGLLRSIGTVKVSCCDENNCKHDVRLRKKCTGLLAGASASGHVLSGIRGSNCPSGYAGWFLEWAVGSVVGVSGEIGIFTTSLERVGGGGLYLGLGIPVQVYLCFYTIEIDDIIGGCGE